jgi:protein SCO1/2
MEQPRPVPSKTPIEAPQRIHSYWSTIPVEQRRLDFFLFSDILIAAIRPTASTTVLLPGVLFMKVFFSIMIAALLVAGTAFGHESTATTADIALDYKLGQNIPADADFLDEHGGSVNLRDAIDRPTIIAPVYLSCMHECPLLLNGLAEVLGKVELVTPGRDFKVITLSFDDRDTPAIALDKKRNYLKAIGKPFPAQEWTFLTGDAVSIKKFTDAIGFKFQRDSEHDFSHPITVVVIARGGKIVRYLEGTSFLPFDITMAVNEAAAGRVGSPGRRMLMYCFSYDPLKKSYVFNILKVLGTVMILFVGSFFAYLMITTRKKRGAL